MENLAKKATVIQMPTLPLEARRRWEQVPEAARKAILDNAWCSECRTGIIMQFREAKMVGTSLILHGTCKTCGGEVARVIEPAEV